MIHVVDCTLREGEQTAGVWFSIDEKLAVVDALAALGIRLLDAGMPGVSEDERIFLRAATGRTSARIGASVRALTTACQLAVDTGCDEVFIICPVSVLHRESRLKLSEAGLLKRITDCVKTVVAGGRTCNVVAEDASRATPEGLRTAMTAAMDAGADRLFLCDTVGQWTPSSAADAFRDVAEWFPGVPLGAHCHNDLGMATANTVAAVEVGCTWPTVTVNGVGERAGNAELFQVAATVERLLGHTTGLNLAHATAISRQVELLTGFVVPQHQPLVGWNAFRHESGIHVDGMLKEPTTYASVEPEVVGREHAYVVGKHSGRALLRRFAEQNDWPHDNDTLSQVLTAIKTRRPDWVRESFTRVRQVVDRYNETCLGVPEGHLNAIFSELLEDREPKKKRGP